MLTFKNSFCEQCGEHLGYVQEKRDVKCYCWKCGRNLFQLCLCCQELVLLGPGEVFESYPDYDSVCPECSEKHFCQCIRCYKRILKSKAKINDLGEFYCEEHPPIFTVSCRNQMEGFCSFD